MAKDTPKNKTYQEKLEDPRWKLRRMEILVRDKGRCVKCLSPHWLEVHHKKYISGLESWDYPDELLETLCRKHHSQEGGYSGDDLKPITEIIPKALKLLKAGIVL